MDIEGWEVVEHEDGYRSLRVVGIVDKEVEVSVPDKRRDPPEYEVRGSICSCWVSDELLAERYGEGWWRWEGFRGGANGGGAEEKGKAVVEELVSEKEADEWEELKE